jgi:hypothetical protein
MKAVAWAAWPLGLLLTIAHTQTSLLPLPVFVALDAVYAVAVAFALRRAGLAAPLLAAGPVIFFLAALTGVPTASAPAAMLANAGVLLAAAALLVVGYAGLAVRLWDGPGRGTAALAILLLTVGTTGYLANLLARFAVVLGGAAPAQAAVEATAWQAHAYLQGLSGQADNLLVPLLVWLDLLQVSYVVLAYLATAALATALRRAALLSDTAARLLTGAGVALAGAVLVAAVLASVPAAGVVAAGVAFALTIPFMSTLLPWLLGAAMPPSPVAATHAHGSTLIPVGVAGTRS